MAIKKINQYVYYYTNIIVYLFDNTALKKNNLFLD